MNELKTWLALLLLVAASSGCAFFAEPPHFDNKVNDEYFVGRWLYEDKNEKGVVVIDNTGEGEYAATAVAFSGDEYLSKANFYITENNGDFYASFDDRSFQSCRFGVGCRINESGDKKFAPRYIVAAVKKISRDEFSFSFVLASAIKKIIADGKIKGKIECFSWNKEKKEDDDNRSFCPFSVFHLTGSDKLSDLLPAYEGIPTLSSSVHFFRIDGQSDFSLE